MVAVISEWRGAVDASYCRDGKWIIKCLDNKIAVEIRLGQVGHQSRSVLMKGPRSYFIQEHHQKELIFFYQHSRIKFLRLSIPQILLNFHMKELRDENDNQPQNPVDLYIASSEQMQYQDFLLHYQEISKARVLEEPRCIFPDAFQDPKHIWPIKPRMPSKRDAVQSKNDLPELETPIEMMIPINQDLKNLAQSMDHEETEPNSQMPLFSEQTDSERYSQRRRSRRGRNQESQKKKREPYVTKNLLQTMAPFFLHYIQEQMTPSQYRKYSIIRTFEEKKGKNLSNFQELLNEQGLRPLWSEFFAERELYRLLMMTKVSHSLKRVYFSKIHIFERAFKTGVLDRIN